jgi:serine/threonine-protein kinase
MTKRNQPQIVLSRYALFDAIARGGMATVHIGRLVGAAGFAKTVAVKRMHAHLASNPAFVGMFVDEARLAGRLQHPNVVNVFDVVAREDEAFLVMEYVHGESLATLMAKLRDTDELIPVAVAVQVVRDALYGLHAAHQASDEQGRSLELVHRDVSPQNILVGLDGIGRVLDFGIAKAAGRLQDSTTGQVKGKFGYMSPEQVVGHAVDRRADVYAAGVVLWEALTGRRLFDGQSSAELVYRVLEEPIPPCADIRPEVDERLSGAIARATSKRRDDRFVSAEHFARELEECAPLLPPSQVGHFVQRVGGVQLERRRARVAEIEALQLEDVGDMPSGPEMASRLTHGGTVETESLIMAGAGEQTVVDRAVTTSSEPVPRRPKRVYQRIATAIATAALAAFVAIWVSGGSSTPAAEPSRSIADEPIPPSAAKAARAPGLQPGGSSGGAPSHAEGRLAKGETKAEPEEQGKLPAPPATAARAPTNPRSPTVGTKPRSAPKAKTKPRVEDLFVRE